MYELSLSFCHKHPESSHSEKEKPWAAEVLSHRATTPQDKEFINVLGISYNASLTHLLSLRLLMWRKGWASGGPVAGTGNCVEACTGPHVLSHMHCKSVDSMNAHGRIMNALCGNSTLWGWFFPIWMLLGNVRWGEICLYTEFGEAQKSH